MKVILLDDVANIGHRYEIKNVSDGYAANFLIPRKLAEIATVSKVKELEKKKEVVEKELNLKKEYVSKGLAALNGTTIEISETTNEHGHLFKGIHKEDIAKAFKEQKNIELDSNTIVLEQPIKQIGKFDIKVEIEKESALLTLVVTSKNPTH